LVVHTLPSLPMIRQCNCLSHVCAYGKY